MMPPCFAPGLAGGCGGGKRRAGRAQEMHDFAAAHVGGFLKNQRLEADSAPRPRMIAHDPCMNRGETRMSAA